MTRPASPGGRTWRPGPRPTVLAADLGDGTDDPHATAPDLLRRALASLAPRAGIAGDAWHDVI